MSYFRWSIGNVTSEAEPIVTELCIRFGAVGVSENLLFTQPELVYEPEVVDLGEHILEAYFIEPPHEGLEETLRAHWPELTIRRYSEEDKDWLAEWKKGYKAFPLVDQYWVVPSWESSPVSPAYTLKIDPGMAFGTGTHETTQLAARHLIEDVELSRRASFLDVGTGTGILALLACREKIPDIVGIEIDDEARRVARENVMLNSCRQIQIPDESVEMIGRDFDVVVANIIDGVLLKLKPHLLRCLAPTGALVLSGILQERASVFLQDFLAGTRLVVRKQNSQGEWVSYVLANGPA